MVDDWSDDEEEEEGEGSGKRSSRSRVRDRGPGWPQQRWSPAMGVQDVASDDTLDIVCSRCYSLTQYGCVSAACLSSMRLLNCLLLFARSAL